MTILNRLKKIETTMQQSSAGAVLLREPAGDAGQEARKAYEAAVSEALTAGQRVIVRTAGTSQRQNSGNIRYEESDFGALCSLLGALPANGGGTQLDQIIASVQGTPLPVVRSPE